MIPRLFDRLAYDFSNSWIGELYDATEVIAEENSEDGHSWELSFNYPNTGNLFPEIGLEKIVVAKVNSHQDPQAFRIYSIRKALNQTIEVHAQHISYDLGNIPVKPFSAIGAQASITALTQNMLNVGNKDRFSFYTDIPDPENQNSNRSSAETKAITVEFEEPKTSLSVLLDGDDSIHGKFGGDIIANNWSIRLLEVGGVDSGVSIDYGVDLVDFDQERSISDMITGILPYYVRDRDIRLDINVNRNSDVMDVGGVMVQTDSGYTLEAGSKYTLTFTPENTQGTAHLTSESGFNYASFSMDGNEKKYEIIPVTDITVSPNTSLVIADVIPTDTDTETHETVSVPIGSLTGFTIVKNFVEPILYGDIVNGLGEYNDCPKIVPVNLTEYFQDQTEEPTSAQITAKGREYVSKEEIGIPEVSLTISNADVFGKDIHLYDAVRVRFIKMGVDVKSKVTRYKYDVLKEQCIEIDVGKTKDSAIFTLQDASRLRRGLLPPDRIDKNSIAGDKIKKGSIGKDQIGKGAISSWNMPIDIIDEDLLNEKVVGQEHLRSSDGTEHGTKRGAILMNKPAYRENGWHRDIGYVFDPSLGVPMESLPGWTDSHSNFKPMIQWKQNIPYDQGNGVGYVLDPDFVFDGSLDGNKKLADSSVGTSKIGSKAVTGAKISDSAVTEDKVADDNITRRKLENTLRAKIAAWESINDNVGPVVSDIGDDNYMDVPFLSSSRQFYVRGGDIAFPGPSPSYGTYHFSPHTLNLDGNQIIVLSNSNGSISIPPLVLKRKNVVVDVTTTTKSVVTGVQVDFLNEIVNPITEDIKVVTDVRTEEIEYYGYNG